MRQDISIPTPEGAMRAFVFTPDAGAGPWPAAILAMDGVAIRPAMFEMGERLAGGGYYVLLPDLFWRSGAYAPLDAGKIAAGDTQETQRLYKMFGALTPDQQMADVKACLAFLDGQPKARADKVGITGYCMGGGVALRAAGTFPDRIAAAASFHGGRMATDDAASPHLMAPRIKAKVLVAGADEDASFDPAEKDRLAAALAEARVDAEVSIWKGLRHGWVPTDVKAYDAQGAERHWQALFKLFEETLKSPQPA